MRSPRDVDAALEADPETAASVRRNRRAWDDLLRADPELTRLDIAIALAGRVLATDEFGSPQYATAVVEDRDARDRRRALLIRREGAKRLEEARRLAEREAGRSAPTPADEDIPF